MTESCLYEPSNTCPPPARPPGPDAASSLSRRVGAELPILHTDVHATPATCPLPPGSSLLHASASGDRLLTNEAGLPEPESSGRRARMESSDGPVVSAARGIGGRPESACSATSPRLISTTRAALSSVEDLRADWLRDSELEELS